ncbi:MAG: hydrogenase maturation protease [Verrucomicrobiales bacterium]|nr:hydrogenase maturation protease [Verrucomicrobiales bacterium]
MSGPGPVLIVGFGNPLRGDDAAGLRLIEALETAGRPAGVETLAVHQLTPELAERVAAARAVVFVDAACTEEPAALRLLEAPPFDGPPPGHHYSPASLLQLTRLTFGVLPPAWLLTLPAADFAFGAPLSPRAVGAVEAGRKLLVIWLQAWTA